MAKGGTRTCSSNTSIEMPAHVGGHSTLTAVGLHTGSITNPCGLMNLQAPALQNQQSLLDDVRGLGTLG